MTRILAKSNLLIHGRVVWRGVSIEQSRGLFGYLPEYTITELRSPYFTVKAHDIDKAMRLACLFNRSKTRTK